MNANPSPKIVRWIGGSIAFLLILAGAGSEGRAQTPDPGAATKEIQLFRHPAGVEIRVLPLRPGVGAAEMLEALESAARELRSRRDVTPTAHQAAVLPGPARSAAPLPAPVSSPSEPSSWLDALTFTGLPSTLLWQPMMANAQQPRMALHLTSLNNSTTTKTIDTAIGGEIGLVRVSQADTGLQIQQDFFGVVLSRFSNHADFTAADYRFGFPLTFAYDNWHAKFGYEHSSTHLGDDFIKNTGQFRQGHIRDELVLALDHVFWKQLRVYGQFGYAGYITTPTNAPPERFGWGVEWSKNSTTTWLGQPFAALDMELRADQDFVPNTTIQVGWQWKDMERGGSFRTGGEFYDGRSPYGQFYRNHESWIGLGAWIDF